MAVTNYYTVNGSIIGESTNGVRTDYLMDALGSVTGTVNSSAQVINTYRYKPFGDLLSKMGTGADPAFGWVGTQGYKQTQKKFSNFYVRARHYGSSQGRWTTLDPIGYADSISNLFVYSRNCPITAVDPTGLKSGCPQYLIEGYHIPPCKTRCSQPFGAYTDYKTDIPRPKYNFRPSSKDCPPKSEWEKIRKYCDLDHGRSVGDLIFNVAFTCCCSHCSAVTGCTQYTKEFFKMPKIYQLCTWDHEKERRQCCADTCSGQLTNSHQRSFYQNCAWQRLLDCFGYPFASKNFKECIPAGPITMPICRYDGDYFPPKCPELTSG